MFVALLQAYHRDLLEQRAHLALLRPRPPPRTRPRPRPLPHPPSTILHDKSPPKKGVVRRGKEKRPGSRRRRRNPKTREIFFD